MISFSVWRSLWKLSTWFFPRDMAKFTHRVHKVHMILQVSTIWPESTIFNWSFLFCHLLICGCFLWGWENIHLVHLQVYNSVNSVSASHCLFSILCCSPVKDFHTAYIWYTADQWLKSFWGLGRTESGAWDVQMGGILWTSSGAGLTAAVFCLLLWLTLTTIN